MTDTELPEDVQSLVSKENFDVLSWLDGTTFPDRTVEIYRDGDKLQQIAELEEAVTNLRSRQKEEKRQLLGITDDPDEDAAINEAESTIDALRKSLVGTGAKFRFVGLGTEVKKVIRERVARSLKSTTDEEGNTIPGGEKNPNFNDEFTYELIRKSLKSITAPSGAEDTTSKSVDDIKKMKAVLPNGEWLRLQNKAYEVNYYSYDLEKITNVDFS